MRVGVLCLRGSVNPTGLARYTRELYCTLQQLDHTLEIILLTLPGAPHPDWYGNFRTYTLGDGRPWKSRAVALASSPLDVLSAVRRLRLDIVHAPANMAPFIGPRLGAKFVATVHDVAPLVLPREHRLVASGAYALGIPPLRWTADAVLTVSRASAEELKSFGHIPENKITVTPCGVRLPSDKDLAQWRREGVPSLGLRPGSRYLLAVGDVRPRKNLVRVLKAAQTVMNQHADVRVVVAGQLKHCTSEVTGLLKALGPRAIEAGYVDEPTLHRLYANASVLLCPSLHEGFGLSALEGMAYGANVVASALGAYREVVGSAGLLVDPRDVRAIAAATERFLDSAKLARRHSEAGREHAEDFSWERTAVASRDVYQRLLTRAVE